MLLILNEMQQVIDGEEEQQRVTDHRIRRKRFRDALNPFELPNRIFRQNFRLNKAAAHALIERLTPHLLTPSGRRNALTPMQKVLTSLVFLAHGSYQRGCVAEHNQVYLCQASVSNSLHNFLDAMDAEIVREVIKFPQTEEERDAVKQGFYDKFGFPGCCGAIDGTLIRMVKPHLNEEQYHSHKGFHCINVQLICDSNLKIMAVNPRHGGRTHDGFIWRLSAINRDIRNLVAIHGEEYLWLIGDSGYPLQPWLLTPILDADPNTPQGRYTKAHILARNCIERVNGVLKNKWRCMLGARSLHYHPDTVRKIIRTCCALHNIGITQVPEFLHEHMDHVIPPEENVDADPEPDVALGQAVRTQVIANHFT